jgi:hypothetical protein
MADSNRKSEGRSRSRLVLVFYGRTLPKAIQLVQLVQGAGRHNSFYPGTAWISEGSTNLPIGLCRVPKGRVN